MCYDEHQKELDNLTIKRGNLLEIRTLATQSTCRTRGSGSLNNKPIVYGANALRHLGGRLHHDHRLRILPFGAIDNIRKFKLNYKPIKNTKSIHNKYRGRNPRGSDHRNIVKVNKSGFKLDSRVIFATANVQSIRLKELQVSQLISDYSLDFIVLTETWLNSNHSLWKDTCTLNKAPAQTTYSQSQRG